MYENYKHLKLNEVVIAGSHDGGITSGKSYVRTQELDIFEQAQAGVRFFDIRVTAVQVAKNNGEISNLPRFDQVAYHGSGKTKKRLGIDHITHQKVERDVTRLCIGDTGMSLSAILSQALRFVNTYSGEFVVLKFNKCDNYPAIADACQSIVRDKLYEKRCFLNTKTLRDLAGRVIVLFPHSCNVLKDPNANKGILGWQNLNEKRSRLEKLTRKKPGPITVNASFEGLQYYGKGGTNPFSFKFKNNKIASNAKKQRKLMLNASTNKQVVGMMYWTTTGMLASIQMRNDRMWSEKKIKYMTVVNVGLRDMWDLLVTQISNDLSVTGVTLRQCIPNIVMIDFANLDRCSSIVALNRQFTTEEEECLAASLHDPTDDDAGGRAEDDEFEIREEDR